MPVVDQEISSDGFNNIETLQSNQNPAPRAQRSVSFAPDVIYPIEEPGSYTQTESDTGNDEQPVEAEQHNPQPTPQDTARTPTVSTSLDGTGQRFKIAFQENRLRFDQSFPPGLELRIPESEFEIVLEQIHREFIVPVDKTQKAVRKWSAIVAGTAPIAVGFFLSIVLARRVSRHQKTVRNFWITLRNHLKTINKDIYYARGIEWRIERDAEKIEKREAYNKLYAFRIEIVFRKAISVRSAREIALRSTLSPPTRSSHACTIISSQRNAAGVSLAESDLITDPELLALLSTVPAGGDSPEIMDENGGFEEPGNENGDGAGNVDNENGDRTTVYSSPSFVADHFIVKAGGDEPVPEVDEDLFVKVEESEEVKNARRSSIFEPPSIDATATDFDLIADLPAEAVEEDAAFITVAEPAVAVEQVAKEGENVPHEPSQKMSFADLLRSNLDEENDKVDPKVVEAKTEEPRVAATEEPRVAALSAVMAASALRSNSPENNNLDEEEGDLLSPMTSSTHNAARESREEAFAQRQRKKFSRANTTSQLYDIPESPKLGEDDDPTGDALEFLNDDGDDLIEEILGVSVIGSKDPKDNSKFGSKLSKERKTADEGTGLASILKKKPVSPLRGGVGGEEEEEEIPVAAYPMANPFTFLYETDQVIPLDPVPEAEKDQEYSEVDGDAEFVKRKKWRVDPERADKVSPVQRMSESIKPASRRSSFMPPAPSSSDMKFA